MDRLDLDNLRFEVLYILCLEGTCLVVKGNITGRITYGLWVEAWEWAWRCRCSTPRGSPVVAAIFLFYNDFLCTIVIIRVFLEAAE